MTGSATRSLMFARSRSALRFNERDLDSTDLRHKWTYGREQASACRIDETPDAGSLPLSVAYSSQGDVRIGDK